MQITTVQEQQTTNRQIKMGPALGLVAAVVLFGIVLAQTGLLNGLKWSTADALPSYQASNMRFETPELRLKAGQPLTIALDNADLYAHSFDIDDLDIHIPLPANSQTATTLTINEPGTYLIYCGITGHRAAGMVGTLVVVADSQ